MRIELKQKICDAFSQKEGLDYESMEYMEVEVDDVTYFAEEEERLTTEDEGKYQFGGTVYRIISNNPLDCDFFIRQDFYQTGSYYSYQEVTYEQPYIVEKVPIQTYKWKAVI